MRGCRTGASTWSGTFSCPPRDDNVRLGRRGKNSRLKAHKRNAERRGRQLLKTDIAKQLGISLNAVKQHIRAVFTKLGASNRTEAVAIALRKHLLKL